MITECGLLLQNGLNGEQKPALMQAPPAAGGEKGRRRGWGVEVYWGGGEGEVEERQRRRNQ